MVVFRQLLLLNLSYNRVAFLKYISRTTNMYKGVCEFAPRIQKKFFFLLFTPGTINDSLKPTSFINLLQVPTMIEKGWFSK